MTALAFAVLMILVLGWSVVSERLARWNITGPMVFTLLAEVTLALLLFSDAARVNIGALRRSIGVPARLLGIGLPLTVILGTLAAAWIFKDFTWALAGFVAAALAPTDAALSAQLVNDKRIPIPVRRALNVESGLNDGIVTPVVIFTLAVVAGELGVTSGGQAETVVRPLVELGIGIVVGIAIGLGSAILIAFGSRRRWMLVGGRRLATLAAALSSYTVAVTLDGNGFIAAFVAGIAFGWSLPKDLAGAGDIEELPELVGEVLGLVVWFLFGAALVPVAFRYFSVWILLYAVLSLTVIRILPVALALLGTRQNRSTVLFVGWFGPRGLASVVFALLAVEQLGESAIVGEAVSAVTFTVLLSVILHGASAGPLGRLYARGNRADAGTEHGPRSRRQIHH